MKKLIFALLLLPFAALARDISVAWDDYSVTEPDAAGINVYYAEHVPLERRCTSWALHNNIPLATTETQYTLTGLDDFKSYCIEIRGVDAYGVESSPSNAVMFLLYRQLTGPSGLSIQ